MSGSAYPVVCTAPSDVIEARLVAAGALLSEAAFANPVSASIACRSARKRMLAGLKSRWMQLRLCRCRSACVACSTARSLCRHESGLGGAVK